jgi:hypothetical protein
MSITSSLPCRVAIVSLTRQPVDFSVWVDYHLRVVGVDCFFVQVEDTPSLETEYADHPRVHVYPYRRDHRNDDGNQYVDLQRRQVVFIQRVLEDARSMGIDYLLHIDDDELLHVSPRFQHRVAELVEGLGLEARPETDIHFQNVEAVYDDSRGDDDGGRCFRATTFVDCRKGMCRSYANGKSMGRVSNRRVRPHGPHHFSGATFHVPRDDACILHFDSCTVHRWRAKFQNLAEKTSPEDTIKIPFPYYRESIEAVRGGCPDCGDEVWRDWTTASTSRHPEGTRLSIPHPGSTMMPGV